MRPLAITFGEFINEFFSALTKDLSFYQYVPLITLVTVILVPVTIYFMSLLSLILFNYEFNFFHLISFKKGHAPPAAATVDARQSQEAIESMNRQKKEMFRLLGMIKGETKKLAGKYDSISAVGRSQAALTKDMNDAMRTLHQQHAAIQYHNISSTSSKSSSSPSRDLSVANRSRGNFFRAFNFTDSKNGNRSSIFLKFYLETHFITIFTLLMAQFELKTVKGVSKKKKLVFSLIFETKTGIFDPTRLIFMSNASKTALH